MFLPSETLTMHNADLVVEAGLRAVASGQTEIDLSGLTAVDSAAVATLLAWRRAASAKQQPLTFTQVPASLQSLIDLYGVSDLLPA